VNKTPPSNQKSQKQLVEFKALLTTKEQMLERVKSAAAAMESRLTRQLDEATDTIENLQKDLEAKEREVEAGKYMEVQDSIYNNDNNNDDKALVVC
jgi:hypothetical protein